MSYLRVALTNLGKYNEGELIFEWLELPTTEEEVEAAFKYIGVAEGTEYEEYFITDYEIEELKAMMETQVGTNWRTLWKYSKKEILYITAV